MRKVMLGLMAWLVLSVPVALLVCRVLKDRSEEWDRRERQERLARLARPVSKENRGPLVPQEWQVLKDRHQPDSSAPPGSAQTN